MKKKGFTLVELLAVIAVIAILAVSAIAGINSIINSQKIKVATESEESIAESALSRYVSNTKLYIPACKADGDYVSFDQSVIKRINDQYRQNVLSRFSTEKAKNDEIKRYVKSINEDKTTTGVKNEFNQELGVDDINCFKLTSVATLIEEGYLKDIDNGCDKNTLILIYKKGDSSNQSGKLVSSQEQGICKGSKSEAKGPLITVSPERNLSNEAIKKIQVTITDGDGNLPNTTRLQYGWTTDPRNPPSSTEWQHVDLNLTGGKFKTTVSKQGLDEEFYFWVREGSITDKKGFSNSTFSTGPYAFLATPEITYKTKNNGRCNGETTCHDKKKTVVYSKSYRTNPDGSTTSLCTPECVGYTFLNWDKNGETITDYTEVTDKHNHELNALYDAIRSIVTFNKNGGYDWNSTSCSSPSVFTESGKKCSKQVTYDDPYGPMNDLTRKGYTFTGWYTSASGGTKIQSSTIVRITSAQTLYAHWTPNTYVVTLDSAGGTSCSESPKSIVYDTKYNITCNPTRTGYTFAGWYYGATKIDANTILTEDKDHTLTAHWTPITYSITYSLNSGSATNPTTYTIETATFTLNNPSKTGYDFTGWSGTGLTGSANTSVSIAKGSYGNRSYTANYKAKVFTVKFNGNSSTSGTQSQYTCTYDQACNLPSSNNYTRTGYTFSGWKLANTGTTYPNNGDIKNKSSGEDITFYAQWCQNCTDPSNGTCSTSIGSGGTCVYSTTCSTGYTAANGNTVSPSCNGNSYTIKYGGNSNTGGSTSDTNCTYGTNCTIASNGFTRTGYHFTGWKDSNGTSYSAGQTVTTLATSGSITLYAQWAKNVVYIRYNKGSYGTWCSTNADYSNDNGNVKLNGNINVQTLYYGDAINGNGLLNFRNKPFLCFEQDWFTAEPGKEWITDNGTTFDQSVTTYTASQFATGGGCDLGSSPSCIVTLKINWRRIRWRAYYYCNGGTLADYANQDGVAGSKGEPCFIAPWRESDFVGKLNENGLKNYTPTSTTSNSLNMSYSGHHGTGYWHVGSSGSSNKICQNDTFKNIRAVAKKVGTTTYNDFKKEDVEVKYYAGWSTSSVSRCTGTYYNDD